MTSSADPSRDAWVVMLARQNRRWGGELQRAHLLERLADRTNATVVEGFDPGAVRRTFGRLAYVPGLGPRSGPMPRLAAADLLRPDVLWAMRHHAEPVAVAYYDDALAQTAALGIRVSPVRERLLKLKRRVNLRAFRWLVVPSGSFAELVGLEMERVIVGGNGTDTSVIVPTEWPEAPTIGMVSGAAPGRGIEALVAAAKQVRRRIPDVQLRLWLVASGRHTAAYLAALREHVTEPWIRIGSAGYDRLAEALGQASVLCVPHPSGDYMDVALPVKLYDSMAAGRPLVVTPRRETRALVERHGAGLVAAGDAVEDLAEALCTVLADEALARRLGAAAREAAEREYDWRIVGDRVATTILERERERDEDAERHRPA